MKFIYGLILCLLFIPPVISFADIIFTPEDSFYERHSDKMVYTNRTFVVNNSANIISEPGLRRKITTLQNGTTVHVSFTCLYNGNYWGYVSINNYSGWININQLLVPYDNITFEEEFGADFYSYEGDYAELEEAASVFMWRWPGTSIPPRELGEIDMEHFMMMTGAGGTAYMDEDGREWAYIHYYFGRISSWICLSDPQNGNIPAFNPGAAPAPWFPNTEHIEISEREDFTMVIIIILTAVPVAGAAVLIKVLKKVNRKKAGEKDDD
jgi:hypothetical protein